MSSAARKGGRRASEESRQGGDRGDGRGHVAFGARLFPERDRAVEGKFRHRRIEREFESARRAVRRRLRIAQHAGDRDPRVSPLRRQVEAQLIADRKPVEAALNVGDQRVEAAPRADDAQEAVGQAQARQRRERSGDARGARPSPARRAAKGGRSMSSVTVGLTRMARVGMKRPRSEFDQREVEPGGRRREEVDAAGVVETRIDDAQAGPGEDGKASPPAARSNAGAAKRRRRRSNCRRPSRPTTASG